MDEFEEQVVRQYVSILKRGPGSEHDIRFMKFYFVDNPVCGQVLDGMVIKYNAFLATSF